MKNVSKVLLSLVLLFATTAGQASAKEENKGGDDHMEWWQEARFGMFIHWGIYSVPAGFYKGKAQTNSAEWIMNKGKIPLCEYQKFSDQFNPVDFDAKTFVGLAKEAGMKYMVITAKHHDGFSMFHSHCNPFNIVDATPFKRDVLKELAAECAKQGIRFGFYYSQAQDWSHPGGMGNSWDKKMQRVSTDVYVREKALPEVKQLLTEYGKIAIFWWDTPRKMSKDVIDSLFHITSDLQPGIITNDRLGEEYPGDHKTFERKIPKQAPEDEFWEVCMPISGSWGYRSDDDNFKSIPTLISNLVDIASKGGNYLLNVSPTAKGTLLPDAVERLKAMGEWMNVNSESIYGTQASPCVQPEWGRVTMKAADGKATLYLNVFDWPKDGKISLQLNNRVKSCYLLSNTKRKFKTKSTEDGISIQLTGEAPDKISSVVVLKLAQMPKAILPEVLSADENGRIVLPAKRAQHKSLDGPGAEYQESKDCIGYWTNPTATVYWTFKVDKPGTYDAVAEVSGLKDAAFMVRCGEEERKVNISASGSYSTFIPLHLGRFTLNAAGEYKIAFKPYAGSWNATNMRTVSLKPQP